MQLLPDQGRQAAIDAGIHHADAKARSAIVAARPADQPARVVGCGERNHFRGLCLIGLVERVDVGDELRKRLVQHGQPRLGFDMGGRLQAQDG